MLDVIGFLSFIVLAVILVKIKNREDYEDYGYSIVADNHIIKRYRKAC